MKTGRKRSKRRSEQGLRRNRPDHSKPLGTIENRVLLAVCWYPVGSAGVIPAREQATALSRFSATRARLDAGPVFRTAPLYPTRRTPPHVAGDRKSLMQGWSVLLRPRGARPQVGPAAHPPVPRRVAPLLPSERGTTGIRAAGRSGRICIETMRHPGKGQTGAHCRRGREAYTTTIEGDPSGRRKSRCLGYPLAATGRATGDAGGRPLTQSPEQARPRAFVSPTKWPFCSKNGKHEQQRVTRVQTTRGFVNNKLSFLTSAMTRTYGRSQLVFPLCFPHIQSFANCLHAGLAFRLQVGVTSSESSPRLLSIIRHSPLATAAYKTAYGPAKLVHRE